MRVITVDVSELAAPEPLRTVVSRLPEITPGSYIHMIHRMEPCILFPILQENGYGHCMTTRPDGVDIYIWLASDHEVSCHFKEGTVALCSRD